MNHNMLEGPKNDVSSAIFFFWLWFMWAIKITFREKKIVAENRDINSKLKKS